MKDITIKLSLRAIKTNKKSALISVLCIALSVAITTMIIAVSVGITHEIQRSTYNDYDQETFHMYAIDDVQKAIKNLEPYTESYSIENQTYRLKDEKSVHGSSYSIVGINIENAYSMKSRNFKSKYPDVESFLLLGRLSENENELVIGKRTYVHNNFNVGDTVETVSMTKVDDDYVEIPNIKTIVGVFKTEELSNYYHSDSLEDIIQISFKLYENTENMESLVQNLGYTPQTSPCEKNCISFNENYNNAVGLQHTVSGWAIVTYVLTGALVVILSFSTLSLIYNTFSINVERQLQTYGILRSIGATKKQIRSLIRKEAYSLTLVGILLGIFIGYTLSLVFSGFMNSQINYAQNNLGLGVNFNVYPKLTPLALGIIFVFSFIVVSIPLQQVIRRLFKQTSIESIREKDRFKKKPKQNDYLKRFKSNPISLLAYKNTKQDSRRYSGIKRSLVVSIIVFVSLMSVLEIGFNKLTLLNNNPYDIAVTYFANNDEYTESIRSLDHFVKGYDKPYQAYELQIFYRALGRTAEGDMLPFDSAFESKYRTLYSLENLDLSVLVISDALYETVSNKKSNDVIENEAILYNYYSNETYDSEALGYSGSVYDGEKIDEITLADYGDYVLKGENNNEKGIHLGNTFNIVDIVETLPKEIMLLSINSYDTVPFLIVPYRNFDKVAASFYGNTTTYSQGFNNATVYVATDESNEVEAYIQTEPKYSITNYVKTEGLMRWAKTLLGRIIIGIVGFILGISVLNMLSITLVTMEMRRKELAALRSVGMTQKEMNKMLSLESVMMLWKPFIIGTIGSMGVTYLLAWLLRISTKEVSYKYVFDTKAHFNSFILVLLVLVMNVIFSIRISKKKSVIEDLRQN